MTKITIDKNILLVEVPEDATKMNVIGQKLIFFEGDHPVYDLIELIPGSWQFIGTSDNVSEEMAAKIVECEYLEQNYGQDEVVAWTNYLDDSLIFSTALESYQSRLRANKVPSDKRFAILKLNP